MAKHLITITPDLDAGAATGSAYSDNDILFTWTKFDIPKGPVELTSLHATIAGIDGVAGNEFDMGLYFAKAIDGIAPASFGVIHAVTTALITNQFRRNIIAYKFMDASTLTGASAHLIGYTAWGAYKGSDNKNEMGTILQGDDTPFSGDSTYSATPQGYQSIWVAAIAHGAFDFGSEIHLNQTAQAADTTGAPVTLTIDRAGGSTGVANNSFQVGDTLIGATGGPTMEITDMVSGTATSLKVKNISEQIDDDEELVLQYPIRLYLGFEY